MDVANGFTTASLIRRALIEAGYEIKEIHATIDGYMVKAETETKLFHVRIYVHDKPKPNTEEFDFR